MATVHPTSVYRYYDHMAVLIYVGITRRGSQRNAEHFRGKDWWPYVAEQRVEHYPDEISAHVREVELIQLHTPPFNTQHNPDWQEMRSAYLAMRSTPMDPDHLGLWRGHGRALPARVRHQDGGSLALATHAEDAALALRLRWSGQIPVRLYRGDARYESYGLVGTISTGGPFLHLTMESTREFPPIHYARLPSKAIMHKMDLHEYRLRHVILYDDLAVMQTCSG